MLESEGNVLPSGKAREGVPSTSAGHMLTPLSNNVVVGSIPHHVFMFETFTGMKEWSDWTEQFDLAADVNNWDEVLKLFN